jgi:hypothetical protein
MRRIAARISAEFAEIIPGPVENIGHNIRMISGD